MNWIQLRGEEQLQEIKEKSVEKPQVIFKHSTRCSISAVAKSRLEKAGAPQGVDFYYLDLINFRSVSNKVVDEFKVHHESPQILVIRNGECVYDESHMSISMDDIEVQVM